MYVRLLARVHILERMALVGTIYHDSLAPKDDRDDSAVTLMSNDADSAAGCGDLFHQIWAEVLEVCIGMYLLAKELGWVCIFPVVIVFGTLDKLSRETNVLIM